MNLRVEAAARSLEQSTREITERVRPLSREQLMWRPAPEVWSVLDNLAHIEEFVPFWIGEIQAMLATPPQPWGRDQSHPGRLAAVRDTSQRDVRDLLANIEAVMASACGYLRTLDDSDLQVEAQSRNPRWAVQPVAFVVDTLLVKHLSGHLQQIERALQQATEADVQ